jgi:uncharacterized membrane protein (DUF373 family)
MNLMKKFETAIIWGLVFLLALVIGLTLVQVAWEIIHNIISTPEELIALDNLFDILSSIFMVLIGIELLETVKLYLQNKGLHVELILDVALIAVARKVIVLDYSTTEYQTLLAIGVMVLALGISRFLKTFSLRFREPGNI